jgi:hypothetical protein
MPVAFWNSGFWKENKAKVEGLLEEILATPFHFAARLTVCL